MDLAGFAESFELSEPKQFRIGNPVSIVKSIPYIAEVRRNADNLAGAQGATHRNHPGGRTATEIRRGVLKNTPRLR